MNLTAWTLVMAGAIVFGYAVAGLFFLRFWMRTKDRLFACFAFAFWILAIERLLLVHFSEANAYLPFIYLVRLAAFLLIILAVVDKNRKPA